MTNLCSWQLRPSFFSPRDSIWDILVWAGTVTLVNAVLSFYVCADQYQPILVWAGSGTMRLTDNCVSVCGCVQYHQTSSWERVSSHGLSLELTLGMMYVQICQLAVQYASNLEIEWNNKANELNDQILHLIMFNMLVNFKLGETWKVPKWLGFWMRSLRRISTLGESPSSVEFFSPSISVPRWLNGRIGLILRRKTWERRREKWCEENKWRHNILGPGIKWRSTVLLLIIA